MAEHEHPELPPEVDFYEAEEEGVRMGSLEPANEEDETLATFRKLMELIKKEQKLDRKQPVGFRPACSEGPSAKETPTIKN